MQFFEKQERQLSYMLDEDWDLNFGPIFDKMLEKSTNQIAILLPKNYFYDEDGVEELISDIALTESHFQEEFEEYIQKNDSPALKNNMIALEGYYRKCYKDFDQLDELDIVVILYFFIRLRKNIDGIKSLIKVGKDYEL